MRRAAKASWAVIEAPYRGLVGNWRICLGNPMTPFQEPAWRIHEVEPASRLRNYKKRWRAALAWAAPSRLGGGRIYASFAGWRSAPLRRIWPGRQERIDERIGEHRQKRRQAFAGCARLM